MSIISLRLNGAEEKLIKEFARLKGISVSMLIRNSVIENIENEIDLEAFNKAEREMTKIYSFDETMKELGLWYEL